MEIIKVDPYLTVIGFSVIIIFSYLFNLISKYAKIPSVLLLMGTGIGITYVVKYLNIPLPDLFSPLSILGVVGLLMIVMEGALDLELKREKLKLIVTSFLTAAIILGITTFSIAYIINTFIELDFYKSMIYAIPLSVVSSAIVIPSLYGLSNEKREFMIYESTFSDILGIMLFDFMILETEPGQTLIGAISFNIIFSIVASIVVAYVLVFTFQKIKTEIKLFLFIAIIALLFALGKYFHLSALLVILIFGIILRNHHLFFFGKLASIIDNGAMEKIKHEFKLITGETAFLIRTFFFIVFGMTIDLSILLNESIILIGGAIVIIMYIIRLFNLKIFFKTSIIPELFMAPRGLITILLFYKIPEKYLIENFDTGLLFFIIIATNLIMMFGLMLSQKEVENLKDSDIT